MKLQLWCDSEWVTADIAPAPADRPEVSNNLQMSPMQLAEWGFATTLTGCGNAKAPHPQEQ